MWVEGLGSSGSEPHEPCPPARFPQNVAGQAAQPLPQSGSAVRMPLSLCPGVPAALRGWESGSVRSARCALPLPPGLRSGAGRRGLKIPGGSGSGGGSGAAGLRAWEAVRAGLGPFTDMLTFFLVSGGSLWLFAGKSRSDPDHHLREAVVSRPRVRV